MEDSKANREFFRCPHRPRSAFTLIELLVSFAVFSLLMALVFSVIGQTSSILRHSTNDLNSFQSARQAFDILTRSVGQATLGSYWDYQFTSGQADRYRRNSDLNFIVGPAGVNGLPGTPGCGQAIFFQALLGKIGVGQTPTGAQQLLNEIGFYVEFGSNLANLPTALSPRLKEKYRYRLFQSIKPTSELDIYKTAAGRTWVNDDNAQPIADNVIALVLVPRRASAEEVRLGPLVTDIAYDSRLNAENYPQPVTAHQLPPFCETFLVAIDEDSATRLANGATPPTAIAQALSGKFQTLSQLEDDLEGLISELQNAGVAARIFSIRLPMRESKWSEF